MVIVGGNAINEMKECKFDATIMKDPSLDELITCEIKSSKLVRLKKLKFLEKLGSLQTCNWLYMGIYLVPRWNLMWTI